MCAPISPHPCQDFLFFGFLILMNMKEFLIVFFIYISLMTNDVSLITNDFLCARHSFANLLLTNIYSICCPLLIGLFVILLLSCKNLLYSLYKSLLSDMWFLNILSHSMHCIFILLMKSFAHKTFTLWLSLTYFLDCISCLLGVISKKWLYKSRSLRFMSFPKSFIILACICVFDAFWVKFCIYCEAEVRFLSFACTYPITIFLGVIFSNLFWQSRNYVEIFIQLCVIYFKELDFCL